MDYKQIITLINVLNSQRQYPSPALMELISQAIWDNESKWTHDELMQFISTLLEH